MDAPDQHDSRGFRAVLPIDRLGSSRVSIVEGVNPCRLRARYTPIPLASPESTVYGVDYYAKM